MRQRTEHFKLFTILALTTVSLSVERLHGSELLLPKPTRLVSDMASVLGSEESARLEARLERLRDSGVAAAIIYIAPSLPEQTVMEELTLRSFNAWGVGDAAAQNGIALFAFIRDRKLRIEVGRGLEGQISDAARTMIDQRIAPAFREGKYAEGLTAAIDQIELLIRESTLVGVRPDISRAATPQSLTPAARKYMTTRLGATQRIVGPANAPRVTRRVNPHYPEKARRDRTQGQVHLEVLINSAGHVADITVTKGLPDGLSEAAMTAVKQWVFEPLVDVEGKPIPALVDVVMMFRLGPG